MGRVNGIGVDNDAQSSYLKSYLQYHKEEQLLLLTALSSRTFVLINKITLFIYIGILYIRRLLNFGYMQVADMPRHRNATMYVS